MLVPVVVAIFIRGVVPHSVPVLPRPLDEQSTTSEAAGLEDADFRRLQDGLRC
jgi:hypothetical protein